MTCDVVYVLGTGSQWDDNELRFSLRSLQKYISGIGDVYVVGHRPKWLTGVVHLPYPDQFACREANIMLKVAHACGHPNLSRQFLHVHDDHFALAPARACEIPNWCAGPLDRLGKAIHDRNPWKYSVLNTAKALSDRGLTTWNFDIHYPIIFNKELYPQAMDMFDWNVPNGYVVKSLYGNAMRIPHVFTNDMKLKERHTFAELVQQLRGRPWFSIGPKSTNNNVKALMRELYPEPSKYER